MTQGRFQHDKDERLVAEQELLLDVEQPTEQDWESTSEVACALDPILPSEEVAAATLERVDSIGGRPLSRRSFLMRLGAAAAVAVAEGGGLYVLDRVQQGKRAQQSVEMYLQAKFRALPTNAQLTAAIPSGGSIINVVRLDDFQHSRQASGPINARTVAVGTSNTFALGTMNDETGPLAQNHAAPQVAIDALDITARDELGLGDLQVWTAAVPGADSGRGNPEDPRGLYGVLTQLADPNLQNWLLTAGADDLLRVRYETFGLDDLRQLAPTINQLVNVLGDVFKLATSNTVSHDIEQQIDNLEERLNAIAAQFGQNLVTAAGIVQQLNATRQSHKQSEIAFNVVYTWDIGRQDRVPFSAITGGNNDPRVRSVLKPDKVDPNFPNRYYLDMNAIPYGHQIAHWAWVKMFEAQNAAIGTIQQRYPGLTIITEQLQDINKDGRFYWVKLPGGVLIPQGDGHPGIVEGELGGIQQLAQHDLAIWLRRVNGKGEVAASTTANFSLTDQFA